MFCLDENACAVSNLLAWDNPKPSTSDQILQACLESDIYQPIQPLPDLALDYQIQDLCFDHIEGDFYHANYDTYVIVMMYSCGYVNATHLCDTISFKPYCAWAQNVSTKNLTEEFTR